MNILYDERLDGPLPQVDKDGLLAELRLRLPTSNCCTPRKTCVPTSATDSRRIAARRCWWHCRNASNRFRACSPSAIG